MTQILISVSHIYISDRYIIFMILVLENMDIQDIVLFNYDDTINGTSHTTLQGFPSPWTSVALDLSQSCHYFLSRFGELELLANIDILGSVTWTAAPIRIFRLDILLNRGYGSVQSFQRGSFR